MKRAFRKSVFNGLVIGLTAGAFSAGAFASDKVINESFHPYKDQMPSHEGLSAGMTIDESNVAQFKDVIDPAFYTFIENGWTSIAVGKTTSFDLHPAYVDATRNALGEVSWVSRSGKLTAGKPVARSRRSRMRMTPAPAKNWPGTTSTATTGATVPPSCRSTGSTGTWNQPRWSGPSNSTSTS